MTRYRDMTDDELIDWAIDGFKSYEVKSSRLIYALAKRLQQRLGAIEPPAVEPPRRAASITELAQRRPLSREAAQYLRDRYRKAYGLCEASSTAANLQAQLAGTAAIEDPRQVMPGAVIPCGRRPGY